MTPAERQRRSLEKKRLIERPWLAWRVPFRSHKTAQPPVTKLAPDDLARVLIA
jgi:hypothetical protein